jgi:hypothetical protein
MVNRHHTFTAQGNLRSPSYALVITWLSEIWESLDVNIIIDSFAECGITSVDPLDLRKQLRHLAETNELVEVDDIIDYDGTGDLVGFIDYDDNENEYFKKARGRLNSNHSLYFLTRCLFHITLDR